MPLKAYLYFATRCAFRQLQGLTAQESNSLLVAEFDRLTPNPSLGREGSRYLGVVLSMPLSIQRGDGGESSFAQHGHE